MPSQSPYLPFDAHVCALRDLIPSVRRVTVTGPDLDRVAPLCLDRRIKLVLPRVAHDPFVDIPRSGDWYQTWMGLDCERRPAVRTYTARAVRPGLRELDIDVVRHGSEGPAGRWIEQVRHGDTLLVVGPVADHPGIDEIGLAWRPGAARTVLIAGDETAAPAMTNIIESLPADARGVALIETPTGADSWPVTAPPGVRVQFLARDGAPHGSRLEALLCPATMATDLPIGAAMAAAPHQQDAPAPAGTDAPEAPPVWQETALPIAGEHYAWLAGESGVVARMRRRLVSDHGWPRDQVAFMGYWKQGRAEA